MAVPYFVIEYIVFIKLDIIEPMMSKLWICLFHCICELETVCDMGLQETGQLWFVKKINNKY